MRWSPSIDPSASPSGLMWQARATSSAPSRTSTTRARSSVIRFLPVYVANDLLHAESGGDGGVDPEHQLGDPLHPQLPEDVTEERRRRSQSGQARLPLVVGAEHSAPHRGMAEVGRDIDTGDGDEEIGRAHV